MDKILPFLKEFGVFVGVAILGIGIMGYGVWGGGDIDDTKVEIVRGGEGASSNLVIEEGQIIVDVAGAVESPGLYKLQSGSRIGDALVVAGGLAQQADRAWVAETINLAEILQDGGKIFIPALQLIGESASQVPSKSVSQSSKVNINTASVGELDGLSGIGEVRAKAIVENRPYANTQELVSKAKIPESVYEKIKDQVSVY